MADPPSSEITRLMQAAHGGDAGARERLWRRVYDELRAIARQRLRGGGPAAVQATALVHDAWLRLGGEETPRFASRTAFFRAAASAMRNALVDEARAESRLKRGGDRCRVTLEEAQAAGAAAPEVLDLDVALERLARRHPRVAELVELRYFAGLTMAEAAAALGVAVATAERDWRFGRTWLRRELDRLAGAGRGADSPDS